MSTLTTPEARARFAASPVARFATADEAGVPHLVPITFALSNDVLYFAVDQKPKRAQNLRRLRNIQQNPRVSVLVDHCSPLEQLDVRELSGRQYAHRSDGNPQHLR